jgi:hypothetical protein
MAAYPISSQNTHVERRKTTGTLPLRPFCTRSPMEQSCHHASLLSRATTCLTGIIVSTKEYSLSKLPINFSSRMMTRGLSKSHRRATFMLLPLIAALLTVSKQVAAQCLEDSALEALFLPEGFSSLPLEGSCCQKDICGMPCPAPVRLGQKLAG